MLPAKQALDLLQDLFSTLASISYVVCKVGNKSCGRSEACFICSMNYCCDHDIDSSKSLVSSQFW